MINAKDLIKDSLERKKRELIAQIENAKRQLKQVEKDISDINAIAAMAVFIVHIEKRTQIEFRCLTKLSSYEGENLKKAFQKAILKDSDFIDDFVLGRISIKDVCLFEDSVNRIYISEETWRMEYEKAANELLKKGKAKSKIGIKI